MKIGSNILVIAFGLLIICCTPTKVNRVTQLSSGVILQNMDTSVRPGDDFFMYVNGSWYKKTEIPADKTSYGSAHILRDKAEEDVKAIIEDASSGNFKKGSDEQKVGDFFASYTDMKRRDSLGAYPLMEELRKIDEIKDQKDLAAYFGYANTLGNMVPFRTSVTIDFNNPNEYLIYFIQGGLGLPEREYYLATDEKSKELRTRYVEHIQNMFALASLKESNESIAKIMELETAMAALHMKKEDARNRLITQTKKSLDDTKVLMPDFPWDTYLNAAEVPVVDSINVRQIEYIKGLNELIKSTAISTWKSYLRWSLLHGSATVLTTAFDNEHFNFYGKTLVGAQKMRERWRRGVDVVNENLGEIVGKVYVRKHFSPEAKARMSVLVENLLKAYESSIKDLDWMTEDTKKEALEKLSKFTSKIGYPDQWKDYSGLDVDKGDLYGNMKRATLFEYRRNMRRIGKPVDRKEWRMTPQTVNAYYMASLNEIVFPAAILQPPFFNMHADDAINYGAIGAVIGHEIGHGFDDQGSTSDGDGIMRNWWTDKDRAEFKKRTEALITQYNEFKVFDDLNVNGAFTLGENIGDLGGLSIALKAYLHSLDGKTPPVMDGFTGIQRVFLGWGQAWMNKSREQYLRNMIKTNVHAPSKFRANGVVRNIPEFYTSFNVVPGDSLYLPPEKRVKIW